MTKPYLQHDDITVYHADCVEVMRGLPAESVDAIITDPPYGISFQSHRALAGPKFDVIEGDGGPYVWWLAEAFRVLSDPGALICFCRWDVQEAFRLAIGWAGFSVKSQIVWDKRQPGMGDLAGAFAPEHEVAWFATKGRYKLPAGRPSSVVSVSRVPAGQMVHPTEKPVPLMRYLVEAVTPRGGIVLDPFMGSGATGLACIEVGCRFVGVDIDEQYVRAATARLTQPQTSLFA